jgi:hypothetical protein
MPKKIRPVRTKMSITCPDLEASINVASGKIELGEVMRSVLSV